MKARFTRVVGAIVIMAALAGCGSDGEPSGQPPVRLAVTEMKGMEQLLREFGTFETELEAQAGIQIELFPVSDRAAAAAALSADQVDLVFTGPAEYVVMAARTDVVPVIGIRRPGYSSCVWTTNETGVTSSTDLAGKKVAMEAIGSTSAHLGPAQILADAGLDPQSEFELVFAGGAMQESLERGDVAAVGAGCHDYDKFRADGDPANFVLLERGPQLPDDVILAPAGLDQELIKKVRTAFEDGWPKLRDALVTGEENEKFAEATLVSEPKDEDYDVVRVMYQTVGVDDFTRFIGD